MKIIPPLFCKIKFVFAQCGRLLITGLAVVRVIRHQVRPADGAFQHIEARDACAVRDAPSAVHPADCRMLAGEILLQPCKLPLRFHIQNTIAEEAVLRKQVKKSPTSIRKEPPEMM